MRFMITADNEDAVHHNSVTVRYHEFHMPMLARHCVRVHVSVHARVGKWASGCACGHVYEWVGSRVRL